jgi:hypothetical protein
MSDSHNDESFRKLMIDWMNKSDDNQRRIFQKLDEQGQTLARLTTTVEIHKKYSENLEKEQKANRAEIRTTKEELQAVDKDLTTKVDGILEHIKEVKLWMKFLKPTKTKGIALLIVVSLFNGDDIAKSKLFRELIKSYFGVKIEKVEEPTGTSSSP